MVIFLREKSSRTYLALSPGIHTMGSKSAPSNLTSMEASTLFDFNLAEAIDLVCFG